MAEHTWHRLRDHTGRQWSAGAPDRWSRSGTPPALALCAPAPSPACHCSADAPLLALHLQTQRGNVNCINNILCSNAPAIFYYSSVGFTCHTKSLHSSDVTSFFTLMTFGSFRYIFGRYLNINNCSLCFHDNEHRCISMLEYLIRFIVLRSTFVLQLMTSCASN